MKRLSLFILVFLVLGAFTVTAQDWKPTKPIQIIVPWGAGGSTDQIVRLVAGDLEPKLGQKIVVVNQAGASGSVGTNTVMQAAPDGYTWASGAAADLGTYKVQGMLDTVITDWTLYLAVANISVFAVNNYTPYKTMDDLLAAWKAGADHRRHRRPELGRAHRHREHPEVRQVRLQARHLRRRQPGGHRVRRRRDGRRAPARGRGGRHAARRQAEAPRGPRRQAPRPQGPRGSHSADHQVDPPAQARLQLLRHLPAEHRAREHQEHPRQGVGQGDRQLPADPGLLPRSGAVFGPSWGAEAQKRAMAYLPPVAWLYYEAGKAKISPDTVGIPKP